MRVAVDEAGDDGESGGVDDDGSCDVDGSAGADVVDDAVFDDDDRVFDEAEPNSPEPSTVATTRMLSITVTGSWVRSRTVGGRAFSAPVLRELPASPLLRPRGCRR